jgi:hypothetical protein
MIVTPYTYDTAGDIDLDHLPFPVIENRFTDDEINVVEANWEPTDTEWFVDHSGFGSPDEPALTIDQFLIVLMTYVEQNPGHGFIITGVGQCQLFVRAYRRR